MFDTTFTTVAALRTAWIVTIIAVAVLAAALALSTVWDGAAYLQGLQATMAQEQCF